VEDQFCGEDHHVITKASCFQSTPVRVPWRYIFSAANTDNHITKALSAVVNVVCCICTLLTIRFYVQRLMLCCSYLKTQVRIIFLAKGRVCISYFVLQSDSCNKAIFTTEVSTSVHVPSCHDVTFATT
jgi:hypothetical protein